MYTDFVLDALEQALYARRPERSEAMVTPAIEDHSTSPSAIPERLAEACIEPSVSSRGGSYDNTLAETINGLYKAKLIHRRAP